MEATAAKLAASRATDRFEAIEYGVDAVRHLLLSTDPQDHSEEQTETTDSYHSDFDQSISQT